MSFQPRMTNRIEGFSIIERFHQRDRTGMAVDLWNVDCAPRAGGNYLGNDPRLFILLEARYADGGRFMMSELGGSPMHGCQKPAVSYIPAGLEMRTEMHDIQYLRHLDLHFDADELARKLGDGFDSTALDRPRFLLDDATLIALAELIAVECRADQPLHDLYGDGLALALLIAVMRLQPATDRKRSKLAAWQLRRAVDYIESNCLRGIRLEELAQLCGLSQSYFSHAFKASTGLPPHQWQMRARINRVKQLLRSSDLSLTAIAAETGFADPAHFAKAFRREVGTSPSNWRRCRTD
ncbi:MAG: helix-turn-helix domain-containing protein [Allorhizobium sp.]